MTTHTLLHHPFAHRPAISRDMLVHGWPRRIASVTMVLVGLAFLVTTLVANLFHVGPAFDRMSNGFRPIMTQQAIQTDRQDIASLAGAGKEIQTKLLPALAQQLGMTPAQLSTLLASQYPAVNAGLAALPKITPQFSSLVTFLDQQRPYFAAADAIPTKSIPATSVPWSFLVIGLGAIGAGGLLWFKPRGAAFTAVGLGAALVVVPLMLSLPHKASYADTLNKNMKPVYNQQLVNQAKASLTTLGAMGTQMQQKMMPALATQLNLTPQQLNTMLAEGFPATSAALKGLPQSMGRFQNVVATFDNHLGDYKTLKPVAFVPVVWLLIGGGIALLLMGGAGLAISGSRQQA